VEHAERLTIPGGLVLEAYKPYTRTRGGFSEAYKGAFNTTASGGKCTHLTPERSRGNRGQLSRTAILVSYQAAASERRGAPESGASLKAEPFSARAERIVWADAPLLARAPRQASAAAFVCASLRKNQNVNDRLTANPNQTNCRDTLPAPRVEAYRFPKPRGDSPAARLPVSEVEHHVKHRTGRLAKACQRPFGGERR